MYEYPDPDEEFELMYGDDLDALRDLEESCNNLSLSQAKQKQLSQEQSQNNGSNYLSNITLCNGNTNTPESQVSGNVDSNITCTLNTSPSAIGANHNSNNQCELIEPNIVSPAKTSKKRSIQELFGEIDDILNEEIVEGQVRKRKRTENDDDLALIDHILELRRLAKERQNHITILNKGAATTGRDYKYSITCTVPKYSFVTVLRGDGMRLYIRCHSEEYEQDELKKIGKDTFKGVMGEAFRGIWEEAKLEINKALDYENPSCMELESGTVATSSMNKAHVDGASLWVDLYRPQRYMELLSDEGTNRILLRWLKLWDKVVFKRKPKFMMRQTDAAKSNSIKTNFKQSELNTNLDEHGFPEKKISLLCGPPGLGKTTLAHMIATHAGYNVVEVNASDDRTPAKFQELLKGATEMEAVIDPMKRPNCVIFDEIDGAPSASIDLLVKFVTGTAMSKKKKGEKKAHTLKRPIICICNDVYVPALRPLRQIAFIVNFPPTASSRLAERLSEIARHQNIKIDTGALLALCEKTENDIRSCLSALHFFKSLSKPITVTHVSNTSVGQKDMQKALFGVWQSIFQIQQSKMNQNHNEDNLYDGSLKHRMRNVLRIVNNFGDYDRLAQGVFENYPNLNNKNVPLSSTCEALEWFCFSDLLNTQIYTLQNYSLSPYLSYGFVVWHFCLEVYLGKNLCTHLLIMRLLDLTMKHIHRKCCTKCMHQKCTFIMDNIESCNSLAI